MIRTRAPKINPTVFPLPADIEERDHLAMRSRCRVNIFLFFVLSLCFGKLSIFAEDLSSSDLITLQAKATQGDPEAQTQLGKFYCGENPSDQDFIQAETWFRRAADQGHSGGQFGLGTLYFFGMGVQKDYAKATQWIRKAANQDNPMAQCTLGRIYYDGLGVAKNFVEAYKWFDLSARHESLLAIRCREIAASHMTSQDVDSAKQLAAQFSVKPKSFKLALNSQQSVHKEGQE
jgi:TPR repeat protein